MSRKALVLFLLVVTCLLGLHTFISSRPDYGEVISRSQEVTPQEFPLLSANIENRPITNVFGGIIDTKKYFHYSFETSSGEVILKEKEILSNYEGLYILEFKKGDENKILQYDGYQTKLVFIMTDEMYKQVFQAK